MRLFEKSVEQVEKSVEHLIPYRSTYRPAALFPVDTHDFPFEGVQPVQFSMDQTPAVPEWWWISVSLCECRTGASHV
jgi:hypothetical protein